MGMKSGMRSSGLATYSATAASVIFAARGTALSVRRPASIRASRGSRSTRRRIAPNGPFTALLEALGDELGDVLHLQPLLRPRYLAPQVHHGEAEGAGARDHVRLHRQRLLHADEVDALLGRRLHPHLPASAPAAEPALAVTRHLDELEAGHVDGGLAGRVEDPVVPPEIAGVVEGHRLVQRLGGRDAALAEQLADDLRVVEHLEGSL